MGEGNGAGTPHGSAHPAGPARPADERHRARARWSAFRHSPFFPATVLVLIVAAAAGLFAGSYTYAMANPTPHNIPTAVTGVPAPEIKRAEFVQGMERALGAELRLRHFPTYEEARNAVDNQQVYAVLQDRRHAAELDVSGASGATVAQLLAETAPRVGAEIDIPVAVRDINPLQKGDPRGLALFYITLASVIVGFVGAIQMSVHARELNPAERIAFTAAYSALGGFTIAAIVDWGLDAVRLPFAESWLILALTMFTSGMFFTMCNALFGRWAMLPTWGLMVLLGNPSSGGAVSWPLLPSLLGEIGRWLPPGASVNAQHTAVYFRQHQHFFPFAVLIAWAALSCTVFWIWRHRHPGGRDTARTLAAED
ncbi:ABC transporter permease [Streptomyces sp. URMC 124]|uniref:ABC transporter permease n=1 Tax=Streptomyces sp. URMC 124 TaxID=3423405 RepID=UPI003F1CED2E